jgi:hypothetical protein
VRAQDKFRAVHWGIEEGLSQGLVNDMIKDQNGFMWFGTVDGLNRFDGSSFKIYHADKSKPNRTIPGNEISGIIEDSLHNIWIGTNKGLSRYDTRADSFSHFDLGNDFIADVPFWATRSELFFIHYMTIDERWIESYNVQSLDKKILLKIKKSEIDSLFDKVKHRSLIINYTSNNN